MSKVKFELNSAGVVELMKSQEMMDVCKAYADAVRDRAGDGFAVNTMVGQNRVHAMVYATTAKATALNYRENTLLKALGGGGG